MHKDDKPIVAAIWLIVGTLIATGLLAGGFVFWSLPYLLGWALG